MAVGAGYQKAVSCEAGGFSAHTSRLSDPAVSVKVVSHPGDLFLWKSEDREPGIGDERIAELGAEADSPLKPKSGSRGPPAEFP